MSSSLRWVDTDMDDEACTGAFGVATGLLNRLRRRKNSLRILPPSLLQLLDLLLGATVTIFDGGVLLRRVKLMILVLVRAS